MIIDSIIIHSQHSLNWVNVENVWNLHGFAQLLPLQSPKISALWLGSFIHPLPPLGSHSRLCCCSYTTSPTWKVWYEYLPVISFLRWWHTDDTALHVRTTINSCTPVAANRATWYVLSRSRSGCDQTVFSMLSPRLLWGATSNTSTPAYWESAGFDRTLNDNLWSRCCAGAWQVHEDQLLLLSALSPQDLHQVLH